MIEKILKANTGVDDYRIVTTNTESYEAFFVHRRLETVRSTDTVSTAVTVYVNHDGALGDSSFDIYRSMTEADVEAKVKAAVARANLVSNQPYTLPENHTGKTELASNFAGESFSTLAAKIAEAVYAADDMEGGSLNAVEIFIYRDTVNVKNSRGVDLTEVKYHAMIEAIPTWTQDGESVELYENYEFTELDAAKITAEIAQRMREVRDRQYAKKPETPLRCRVVLNPKEIAQWMQELLGDYNYGTVYSKSNLHKVGDDLQEGGTGDKLEVILRGQLPYSTHSAAFDADGVPLTSRRILHEGKAENLYGANRFACYLGEEPTGSLRCMEVGCGSLTDEELKAEPYLECVSLSGLQVDLFNDYLGGEIRLAYYFDGEKKTPVTGITMSAKFSEALKGLRLSTEKAEENNYSGPKCAMIPEVTVL